MYNLSTQKRDFVHNPVTNIPKMSRRYLTNDYVGTPTVSLSHLLLEALHKLPNAGKIDRKDDLDAIEAISGLINKISDRDPAQTLIESLFIEALSRRSYQPK